MKNLYPLLLLLCCFAGGSKAWAQQASLSATFTSFESRCRSTGAIAVVASGGSGSYNYKAVGPIATPFTSSSTITGLEAGTYTVVVKDVVQNKELQVEGVVVNGTYADPRFGLQSTDATCAGNDGTISANNLQHGRAPFTYTIIAPSPAGLGNSNTTGAFTGLPGGEYSIRLTDSCGGIQVRTIRIESNDWWVESATLARYSCNDGDAVIGLKNYKGNTNTSGTAFNGFQYGVVQAVGDTLWGTQRSFRFALGKRREVTLVAKDLCGRVRTKAAAVADNTKPALGISVTIANRACSTFSAAATGQANLTNPRYCVYNSSNIEVACNTTGNFSNLAYGSYTMQVQDLCYDTIIVRNFSASAAVPSITSAVGIGNFSCTTFTATVNGTQNFTNPEYCLVNSSGVQVGSCNSTGIFANVPYGTYTIKVKDACSNAVVSVNVTAGRPVPVITSTSVSNLTCTGFNVQAGGSNLQTSPEYCLYDKAGNKIACNNTGQFTNVPYGEYCIRATTSCGDVTADKCFTQNAPAPNPKVTPSNLNCSGFTATVSDKSYLTNPQYCIVNSSGVQVGDCNTTGVFNNLAYGNYTVRITGSCAGGVIDRTVSATRPVPAIDATVGVSNATCATFTATVTGTNLTSPTYYVYDATNTLLASSTSSNVFTNLTYGTYCFSIKDGCTNQVVSKCHTFTNPQSFTVTTAKTCTLNTTDMQVQFAGSGSPFTVEVYHPDGSLVRQATSNNTTVSLAGLPALPAGAAYRVVGTNNCGQGDEKTVVPDATIITRSASVLAKCPSATSQLGSGDLTVTCSSNKALVTPAIISKDGASFSRSYTTNTGNNFLFASLEPGSYVVEYTLQGCTVKEQQTVVVPPYSFPVQDRSAIYQCNDNGFSLGASVKGGVGPYKYEIIGSLPETPSIITAPQNNAVFSINNGTVYSLVRLRSVDACGNATLNDISVLPLQNIAVTASQTCLYKDVELTVDPIPNATYKWYLKQSDEDSVLVNNNAGFTLPFLMPEQTGVYVCHISVNNDCITRVATFNLTGKCDDVTLPVAVQLRGRRTSETAVQLRWDATEEQDVYWYGIERKLHNATTFRLIDSVEARGSLVQESYTYEDKAAAAGKIQYRLRITGKGGKKKYSNIVQTGVPATLVKVLPNPAKSFLRLAWKDPVQDAYQVELYNAVGQRVYSQRIEPFDQREYTLNRPAVVTPGVYLLHCTNRTSGERQVFKVVFE